MKRQSNRRSFMKTSAAVGAGFWAAGGVAPRRSLSANEEIRFACVGVSGKGASDSQDANQSGKVVAICDVDEQNLSKAKLRFTDAATFYDYRKMLEEKGKDIDAVTVSTPDHLHALIAAAAMNMGKHCFCQKPLTKSIWEARQLGEIARKQKVQTQMGNQGTAETGLREAAAKVRAGIIGEPKEVHVWSNRPVWPQGIAKPAEEQVPESLHWNEWLGPAERRPYSSAYHPFKWRGFWDFGTGALGDMACHTVNMPYQAVGLKNPTSVQAITSGHNKISYPSWSRIVFEFPANDWRGPVKLFWYDGGQFPDASVLDGRSIPKSGAVIIGTKGKLFSPDDYGKTYELLGGATDIEVDDVERSPGHFKEFAIAIKTGKPAMSNFPDYAGPLTEVILLGNLSVWAAAEAETQGPKVEWDAAALKVKGTNEYDFIVKPEYKNGYSIG